MKFKDDKLVNPKLLLNLSADSSKGTGFHNGGKVLVGPDQNIYLVIGTLMSIGRKLKIMTTEQSVMGQA